MDATREWRTGVSRQGQGVDPNALQNQVATIANQMFNAAQAKTKLIARIFAETGVKDMFTLLHAIIRKHGSKPQTVRLRNQWVQVDPRSWKLREDMTINVGLGDGSKQEKLAGINMLIAAQEKAVAVGGVSKRNFGESAKELSKLLGHKDADRFFAFDVQPQQPGQPPDPDSQPLPPPQDPKMQIAQMKGEHDKEVAQLKAASEQQATQMKAALEQQKQNTDLMHQAAKNQAEAALAEKKAQLDAQLQIMEHTFKLREAELNARFAAEKHAMEMLHAHQLHTHQMAAQAKEQRASK